MVGKQKGQQLLAYAAALGPDEPENALVVQGFESKAQVLAFIRRMERAGLLEIEQALRVLDGEGNPVGVQ